MARRRVTVRLSHAMTLRTDDPRRGHGVVASTRRPRRTIRAAVAASSTDDPRRGRRRVDASHVTPPRPRAQASTRSSSSSRSASRNHHTAPFTTGTLARTATLRRRARSGLSQTRRAKRTTQSRPRSTPRAGGATCRSWPRSAPGRAGSTWVASTHRVVRRRRGWGVVFGGDEPRRHYGSRLAAPHGRSKFVAAACVDAPDTLGRSAQWWLTAALASPPRTDGPSLYPRRASMPLIRGPRGLPPRDASGRPSATFGVDPGNAQAPRTAS